MLIGVGTTLYASHGSIKFYFCQVDRGIDIDKHLFYNKIIATEEDWEGKMEEYRKKICDLINKTDDAWILKQIWLFVINMTKEGR